MAGGFLSSFSNSYRPLGRAHRVFNREHHVVGHLGELANEGEADGTRRHHLRPVAGSAGQKLAGDVGQHGRNAVGFGQQRRQALEIP